MKNIKYQISNIKYQISNIKFLIILMFSSNILFGQTALPPGQVTPFIVGGLPAP